MLRDSLQVQDGISAIPDFGMRATVLIVVGVVMAVTILLLYAKMKEEDEKSGIS